MRKLPLSILFFLFFLSPLPCRGAALQETTVNRIDLPASASIKVSAWVGGLLFDIEGLTSPWAKVEFSSTQGNVNLETIADSEGVFRFQNALTALEPGDLCFTALDTAGRASPPLCFSPPVARTKTTIRGIILPPTLSLEKEIFRQGETSAAQGATTPSSPIKSFLFEDEETGIWEFIDATLPSLLEGGSLSRSFLVRQTFAREGPPLIVFSNNEGEFDFNLPTYKSTVWKLFVGTQRTQYGDNPSPKSNIIQFAALSWWQWLLLNILVFFLRGVNFFKNLFLNPVFIILLLASTIIIVAHLLIKRRKNSKEGKELIKN